MIYKEFRRHLGKAGLTITEFSRLVQLNKNSVTNYAKKDIVPNHWAVVAALMGEMAEYGLDYKVIISKIAFKDNLNRGIAMKRLINRK
jgi:hypothetical protein